jgi:hypothetical protein
MIAFGLVMLAVIGGLLLLHLVIRAVARNPRQYLLGWVMVVPAALGVVLLLAVAVTAVGFVTSPTWEELARLGNVSTFAAAAGVVVWVLSRAARSGPAPGPAAPPGQWVAGEGYPPPMPWRGAWDPPGRVPVRRR